MSKEVQIVAFEGGALRRFSEKVDSPEAVLALPLNRLLVKILKVPADQDPIQFATPLLQAESPYPDEPLTVSCETVRESAEGRVVIAAALPESAADDIGEALDAAKLSIVKIDSLALGQVRGLWPALQTADGVRKLLLVQTVDCISLFVIDGDEPVALRAILAGSSLKREVTLSLLEAEDFAGPRELGEIVVSGEIDTAELAAFGPVRRVEVGEDAALAGVAERADDAASLNALPASWLEMLEETRFKKKLVRNVSVAGAIWALVMAVLFGVPFVFGYMTDYQKGLSADHRRQYQAVKDMKDKTDVVHKYSDHARGALEIMKAVSDRLPEGITLSSWTFKRGEGLEVSGESESANYVYDFKDALVAMAEQADEDGEDGEKIFAAVNLGNMSSSKTGQKFKIECQHKANEEDE